MKLLSESYELAAIQFNVQRTYQRKIFYHIEVLMQTTKFLFYWTCNVTLFYLRL